MQLFTSLKRFPKGFTPQVAETIVCCSNDYANMVWLVNMHIYWIVYVLHVKMKNSNIYISIMTWWSCLKYLGQKTVWWCLSPRVALGLSSILTAGFPTQVLDDFFKVLRDHMKVHQLTMKGCTPHQTNAAPSCCWIYGKCKQVSKSYLTL